MSKSVLNHNQLKLFMTGTEWKAMITHSTDGPLDRIWPQKEEESRLPAGRGLHGGGVYDSIKEHGYVRSHTGGDPTIIFEESPDGKSIRNVQSEGHHRVAAAAAVERDTGKPVYIPTNYVDNTPGARARMRAYQQAQKAREES
jgi:hypothetical protein